MPRSSKDTSAHGSGEALLARGTEAERAPIEVAACRVLQDMADRDELVPMPGYEGTAFGFYLDILGLDGQPMQDSIYLARQKVR